MKPTFFFDIDGVLHPYGTAKFVEGANPPRVYRGDDDGLFVWASILVEVLKAYPDLQLVAHSTWRNVYDLEELKDQLPAGIAERVVGTTTPYRDKHESIVDYAKKHNIEHYVMIEDDPWVFPRGLTKGVIVVQSDTGISTNEAQQQIKSVLDEMYNDICQIPENYDTIATHTNKVKP